MTREEAVITINFLKEDYEQLLTEEDAEALDMAIEALSQESSEDVISRQAAIDAIMGEPTDAHYPSWYAERLEQLPSAQPDIIRCPDCYYNDGTAYCELHFRNVKAKDFCSWAERRE